MTGAGTAIRLQGVTKSYGEGRGVEELDLEVEAGETLAVLGPNGAGKTTTVELMEGYRRPDRGTVTVLGMDPIRDRGRCLPQLGIMLQEGGVYPALTAAETLTLFAAYYADPEPPLGLLERVGLGPRARARYRQLSGGERQRLSLALALVGRPRVLFLDEPTAGMDPRARRLTWELVRERSREGATVLLTTHSMEEAERLADRVAVIDHGRLVALDTPGRLGDAIGPRLIALETAEELDPSGLSRLRELAQVSEVTDRGGGRYLLRSREPGVTAAAVAQLLAAGGPELRSLRVGGGSLEEAFFELTEEEG